VVVASALVASAAPASVGGVSLVGGFFFGEEVMFELSSPTEASLVHATKPTRLTEEARTVRRSRDATE
jgi:hypothetical protein